MKTSYGLLLVTVVQLACSVGMAQGNAGSQDKVLVRIDVDFTGTLPGSITPAALARWSDSKGVLRAFEDIAGSTTPKGDVDGAKLVPDVVTRNLTRSNPIALSRAIALNRGASLDVADPVGAGVGGSSALFIAPLGTARINPKGGLRLSASPLATYAQASQADLSRLFPGASAAEKYRVLLADSLEPAGGVAKRRTVQLELTREELLSLQTENPGLRHKTFNGTFPVSFGSTGPVGPSSLTSNFKETLASAFKKKVRPGPKPLLVVVDDSWPSDTEFLAAKNFIGAVYPQLWRINSDQASQVAVPELAAEVKRLGSPGVPRGSNCATLEACDTHSRRVQQALEPLRTFAKGSLGDEPVDVIYIPLAASQHGSKEILSLLWNLAYSAGTNLAPNSPTFAAEEATRRRQELDFLGTLQLDLISGSFQSNWAILESVTHFARRYSQLRQVPVYINLSWTTEDTSYNPPILSNWNTLLVAAAGNHCELNTCNKFADEINPQRLFITRAERPIDVLLVVNLDDDGKLVCNSSRIRTNYSVVGFDGALDGDCGTSFSAPRVAWLLAVRAAFAGPPFSPREQSTRLKSLMNLVARRNCTSDDDYRCIRLTPSDILNLTTGRTN